MIHKSDGLIISFKSFVSLGYWNVGLQITRVYGCEGAGDYETGELGRGSPVLLGAEAGLEVEGVGPPSWGREEVCPPVP